MDGFRSQFGNQFVFPSYGVPQMGAPGRLVPGLQLNIGQIPEGLGLNVAPTPGMSTAEARRQNRADGLYDSRLPMPRGPRQKARCQHPGCDKEFAWSQDLAKHVRKYHSGEEPRFECEHEGCGKKFYERKLLVAHERTHTDERPFACKYPGCDKRFRARNALSYHHKAIHEGGEPLRCSVEGCKFTTKKKDALAAHQLRHEQRETEKTWKQQAKGELQAAVKTAKDELKTKASSLVKAQRDLAVERRSHERTRNESERLRAAIDRLKRRRENATAEIERLRPNKRARTIAGTVSGGAGPNANANAAEGAPEVVLVDGPDGVKMPMLAMGPALAGDDDDQPAALEMEHLLDAAVVAAMATTTGTGTGTGTGTETTTGTGTGTGTGASDVVVRVDGAPRRLRPVCAQALPWGASFIGCPGITCGGAEGADLTVLFTEDGRRDAGNRRVTPLEVDHPKDRDALLARAESCPWSRRNVRATLERAGDPLALRQILRECAPKRPGKAKRAEGQCHGCYSAHVALLLALRRRERSAAKGAKGREDERAGGEEEEEGEEEGEDGDGDEEEEE